MGSTGPGRFIGGSTGPGRLIWLLKVLEGPQGFWVGSHGF